VHTGPDTRAGRGKGLSRALAALGVLLLCAAVSLVLLHQRGSAITTHDKQSSPAPAGPPPVHASAHGAALAGRSQPGRGAPPVRLSIPSLKVSAPVIAVRLNSTVLVPPSDPRVLGWWSGGARPGARHGTAVITGHTVHTGGGSFNDLDHVARGDVIRVRTQHGLLRYRVTRVSDVSKTWLAAHARSVFSQDVPGRLALVTCTGWTGTTYLANTVVLATPLAT
jgi:LPXTG-site transpeptidase (sortase) family protein